MPHSLYPQGKNSRYPVIMRLAGLQDWSGCFGEEKNLLFLLGIEEWFLA
jgi:hypothetical protein